MARQGSLKVGGAADTIREVGLDEVCEHALEMEMSDGGFQEQSFPGTGWGEVSPLLSISQHGHAPEGRAPEKRHEGRTLLESGLCSQEPKRNTEAEVWVKKKKKLALLL